MELVAFSAPLEALLGRKPPTLPGAVHLKVARTVASGLSTRLVPGVGAGLEGLGLVAAQRQWRRRMGR